MLEFIITLRELTNVKMFLQQQSPFSIATAHYTSRYWLYHVVYFDHYYATCTTIVCICVYVLRLYDVQCTSCNIVHGTNENQITYGVRYTTCITFHQCTSLYPLYLLRVCCYSLKWYICKNDIGLLLNFFEWHLFI